MEVLIDNLLSFTLPETLGILGFVVSLFLFVLRIKEYRLKKKSMDTSLVIFVDYRRTSFKHGINKQRELGHECLVIELENLHQRAVNIEQISFYIPFKSIKYELGELVEIDVNNQSIAQKVSFPLPEIKGGARHRYEADITELFKLTEQLEQKTRFPRLWIRFIKIEVETTTGKRFNAMPEDNFLKTISKVVPSYSKLSAQSRT